MADGRWPLAERKCLTSGYESSLAFFFEEASVAGRFCGQPPRLLLSAIVSFGQRPTAIDHRPTQQQDRTQPTSTSP
jgi:hypothetical protein